MIMTEIKNAIILQTEKIEYPDRSPCKGLFFRVAENAYYQDGVFFRSIKLTKLKRKSCSGCNKCGGWLEDYMQEDCSVSFGGGIDTSGIHHGDIVEPVYNPAIDFETGIDEGGDIHFKKVKEE